MQKVPAQALYLELPAEWESITDEIFSKGGSDVEAHVAIGLSKEQHKELLKVEEYYDHFDNGMAKAEAWWMQWARNNIDKPSKDVNTKMFETVMNRFFAWNSKTENKNNKKEHDSQKKKTVEDFGKKFKIVNN